jgi:hypothetical protein
MGKKSARGDAREYYTLVPIELREWVFYGLFAAALAVSLFKQDVRTLAFDSKHS